MTAARACNPTTTPDDVDIPAMRAKYQLEREKRLRKEGSKQYVETGDGYAEFAEDRPPHPLTSSGIRSTRTSTSPSSAVASAGC